MSENFTPLPRTPQRTLASVRRLSAQIARSSVRIASKITSPARNLFGRKSAAPDNGQAAAGNAQAELEDQPEQSVLHVDREDLEPGEENGFPREEDAEMHGEQYKRNNRRLTIIPPSPMGLPTRESDRLRQSMQASSSARIIRIRESAIVQRAVEKNHITQTAADFLVDPADTDELVFGAVTRQLERWQDHEIMSNHAKQRAKLIPKEECFRAKESNEPIYKFLSSVAKNDVVAGFLLFNMRRTCCSDEEYEISKVIREACTSAWHERLCDHMVSSLEKRMPKNTRAFSRARQWPLASDQLSSVTTELVKQYTINDSQIAESKKNKMIERLSKPLERRGLDNRLAEIETADSELRDLGAEITEEDIFHILMSALRKVSLQDPKRGEYKALESQLRRREFAATSELINEIRLCEQSYMSDTVRDESVFNCTHCKKKGHEAEQCWYLHPELHPTRGGAGARHHHGNGGGPQKNNSTEKDKSTKPFAGKCHNCGKTGHKKYECPEPKKQASGQEKGAGAAGGGGKETAMFLQHDECYILDGAVPADQACVNGTFKLCETKTVLTNVCRQPTGVQVADEGDSDSDISGVDDTGDTNDVQGNCSVQGERRDGDGDGEIRDGEGDGEGDGNGNGPELDLSLYNEADDDLSTAAVTCASKMLHAIQSDVVEKPDFEIEHAQNKTLLLLGASGKETRVLIDNGCTYGITDSLDFVKNLRKRTINFQGLGKAAAEYYGDAAFRVRTISGKIIEAPAGLTMAYMPNFGRTVLSYHHLKELHWEPDLLKGVITAGKQHVRIINEGRLDYIQVVPTGDAEEKFLLLEHARHVIGSDGGEEEQQASCFLMAPTSGMHYHAMLGHFGKKATINTLKKITDVKIGDLDSLDFDQFCHECAMGKMQNARKGCGRIHNTVGAKQPGHVISMDYMGKFPKSPKGLRYVLSAIDHKSSYGWAEATQRKDDAYEAVDKILKDVRAQTGYTGTIILITDNEPLWTSAEMAAVLKANNAVRRGSIEFEHRSNGLVERFNQTLQQAARCNFAQSGFPPQMWPFLIIHACAMYNRIVQKDGKAPIEKFCGGEVRGADLAPFGAIAYFYEPKEHREKNNKLAMRAALGINVGPATAYGKTNGYAILAQTKRGEWVLKFVSQAVFDTNVYPFKHGLQEVLTTRQYKPLLNALKGTAELSLEYEPTEGDADVRSDKHELLGCKVRMVVKGRTRFGKRDWYGEITDIIKDVNDHDDDSKTKCRIFFQPDADHPEGAWQNVPLNDARDMVVQSETAAIIMDCMDRDLYLDEIQTCLTALNKKKQKKNGVFRSLAATARQPDAAQFQQAYDKEISNWKEQKAYEPGTPGPDDEIVRLMPIMHRKLDELKEATHKARVVVNGYEIAKEGLTCFAPVARMDAVTSILSLIAGLGMGLAQEDVSSAYLHAPAKRYKYALPLPGMEDPTGKHKYIKLLKAIYGEPDAGNAYFGFHIDTHLGYGFQKLTRDGTLLIYRTTATVNGKVEKSILILVTIVDDSILGYQHKDVAEKYFDYLRTKAKIVVSYAPRQFVGLEIDYNQDQRVMRIGQQAYTHKIAQKFGVNKEDPVVTSPWLENADISLAEEEPDPDYVTKIRSMIGAVMWLGNGTRKDITAVVKTAARVMHRPKISLEAFLLNLIQWLFNTRTRTLTYDGSKAWTAPDGTVIDINRVCAYVDSSYANAGVQFQMKSQYGYAIMINGGCVAAGSGLGAFTVDSSSYAEVYALHKASKDIEYIQMIANEIMDGKQPAAIVFEDNTTAIAVMVNNKSVTRSRHFDIKLFYMADLIQRGIVILQYVTTEHQIADILTKATPTAIFNRLSAFLMGGT